MNDMPRALETHSTEDLIRELGARYPCVVLAFVDREDYVQSFYWGGRIVAIGLCAALRQRLAQELNKVRESD